MGKLADYDFAGVVTMPNVKCSDGTTIGYDAFANENGKIVDMRIEHSKVPDGSIGEMILHSYRGGLYGYAFLNSTDIGQEAKEKVQNGSLGRLSVSARCKMNPDGLITSGEVREVSLVNKGANASAVIERVVQHTAYGSFDSNEDGSVELIIDMGPTDIEIAHSYKEGETMQTVADILDTLTSDQADAVMKIIEHGDVPNEDVDVLETLTDEQVGAVADLLESIVDDIENGDGDISDYIDEEDVAVEQSDASYDEDDYEEDDYEEDDYEDVEDDDDDVEHSAGGEMKQNAFANEIEHTEINNTIANAIANKSQSLAQALAQDGYPIDIEHGIANIDVLFPQPASKSGNNGINVYNPSARNVEKMISMFGRSLMSRIKNIYYNISEKDARARGYIKGNETLQSIAKVFYREVTPTSIVHADKIDDDDLIDIQENGIDAVRFLKETSRIKMLEELLQAVFVGDGRPARNTDGSRNIYHISEDNVIPITKDDDLFSIKVKAANWGVVIDEVTKQKAAFQPSAMPKLFMNPFDLQKIKLLTDKDGRYLYAPSGDQNRIPEDNMIAARFGCDEAIPYFGLPQGTLVIGSLSDYKFGAVNNGVIASFEDFDIDLFQHKIASKARVSGAIETPKSFMVITVTNIDAISEEALKFNETGVKTEPSFTTNTAKGDNLEVPGEHYASKDRYTKATTTTSSPSGSGVSGTSGTDDA